MLQFITDHNKFNSLLIASHTWLTEGRDTEIGHGKKRKNILKRRHVEHSLMMNILVSAKSFVSDTLHQCNHFVQMFQDGRINYEEFVAMMRNDSSEAIHKRK